jgi:hypothetical protein
VACKYRERVFDHLLQIAHRPVDHQTGGALELGGQRGEPAKGGDAVPTVVDDQHIPGANRIDDLASLKIMRG